MKNNKIDQFVDNINSLSRENVDEVLNNTYTKEVEFIDPLIKFSLNLSP